MVALVTVTLPLVIGIGIAAVHIDKLAQKSQQALLVAEMATRAGRSLVEQVTAMERSARQYLVLGEAPLYRAYSDAREEFLRTLQLLGWVVEDEAPESLVLRRLIVEIGAEEAALFRRLEGRVQGSKSDTDIAEQFAALSVLSERILTESSRQIWAEASTIPDAAAHLKWVQLWLAGISVLVTALLGTLFVVLINRPLRQIDGSIRKLGSGDLGTPVRIDGGPRDLEELGERLEWLRHRLVELEAQKAAFLQHVSHELKTPLTAIREGAGLLADRSESTPLAEQIEIATIVEENSVVLQRHIEDLLHASARGSGRERRSCRVAWDGIVRTVLDDQRLALSARELDVETELEQVHVLGDPEELRVVVDNLVSNAIKFSPRRDRIRVLLRGQDGNAILEVLDNGPGISPEERERIFEPFFQGRARASGPIKGTGLGLAIASEYVAAHDGTIESVEDPRGGHLRVVLPCDPATREPAVPS